ncbi:peptidylprolyl isomerase [Undibacterium sp.]|uniref:peptidylprolyl isomerase n=1 Tax=Undibacterium sp. TaxID=1914977 RepID=UPI003752BAB3
MTISVNGTEINEATINAEMDRARAAGHPEGEQLRDSAIQELILRNLMMAEAAKLDINVGSEEEIIGTLLQQEVAFDEVDEAACRTFYEENSSSFKQGEMAAASHILFTPGEGLAASLVKAKAEGILADLQKNPSAFASMAREHSACPSGKEGGALGQFGRGQMVPEFEQAVFSTEPGNITPELIETQFGYHIIQVTEHNGGDLVSFDEVKERLQAYLTDLEGRKATHAYLANLVSAAKIDGYELPAFA